MISYIKLPKSDGRYKLGNIKIDKNGNVRGNPRTAELSRLSVPASAPIEMQLNPPLIISNELAQYLGENM